MSGPRSNRPADETAARPKPEPAAGSAAGSAPDPAQASGTGDGEAPGGYRCDFCGETVPSVRRVALDQGYDRLQTPHRERYACAACSERKERSRLGIDRS